MVGKWHLGDRPEHSPTRHGFEYRFGLAFSNDMTRPHTMWPEPLRLYEMDTVFQEGVDQRLITELYTDRATAFIEKHKDEPFFLYLPYTMPHWPWFASERFDGLSMKGPYGDTVEEIDWSVGRILETLKTHGLDDNTLVVFTSDNGGSGRSGGGNNGSLRGFKGSTYEGGMREPFVARWPAKIPGGGVRSGIACTMDLFATLVELAGAAAPSDRSFDGVNIEALLTGEKPSPRDELYYWSHNWESEPQLRAVREGRWKLHFADLYEWPQKTFQPIELYDLHADPSERFEVSDAHGDIVRRLTAKAERFHASIRFGKLPPTHFPPGSTERPYRGQIRSELRRKHHEE